MFPVVANKKTKICVKVSCGIGVQDCHIKSSLFTNITRNGLHRLKTKRLKDTDINYNTWTTGRAIVATG